MKGNPTSKAISDPLREELKKFPENKISDVSFECVRDVYELAKLFIKEGGLKT